MLGKIFNRPSTTERETPPRSSADPEPGPSVSLEAELQSRIAASNRELLALFGSEARDSDALRLLRSMEDGGVSMIRQPPVAAQKLLQVSRRPEAGANEMIGLIEKDPALSQAILKYANSALMAVGSSVSSSAIVTARAAVQRIGSKGVNVVVMAQLVEGQLCKPGGGYDEMAQQIWNHMVRTAPLARDLAPAFRADGEHAYSLGLLHDVGKLILFNRITDMRRELRRPAEFPGGFVEEALFRLHEPLGGIAFLQWGLGEPAARSVSAHHRSGGEPGGDKYAQVVYLAERVELALHRGQEVDLEGWWREGGLTGDPLQARDVVARLTADEAA